MKKKIVILFILLSTLGLILFKSEKSYSVDISKEQCIQMISFGDDALLEKDYVTAKNYYKRAIQYDPWNISAWEKYDILVQVMTEGKEIDLSKIKIIKGGISSAEVAPVIEDEATGLQGC